MLPTLGIDGCIMRVVSDILKDRDKERKFRDVLEQRKSERLSRFITSIFALAAVYDSIFVPSEVLSSPRYIREFVNNILGSKLQEDYRCQLALGINTDVGFLVMLGEHGLNRLNIMTGAGKYTGT